MATSFAFTILFMFLLLTTTVTTTTLKSRLFIKPIHRNSIPIDTPTDNTYYTKTNKTFASNDVQSYLFYHDYLYAMNFSIGQPPIPQQAFMDSGSDLIWVKCGPSGSTTAIIFNPSNSSTFANVSCNSESCQHYSSNICEFSNNCKYNRQYADGTSSQGYLATEQFTFETSDEGPIVVPNVVVGCDILVPQNQPIFAGQSTGLFGIGPSSLLVSELGNKFSYCIGSINNPNYIYNHLILGDGAIIQGDSTPFQVHNKLYHITMEGISIGEKRLNIDTSIFRITGTGSGGVIIDSGAPLIRLAEKAYEIVRNEVEDILDKLLTQVMLKPRLCYEGIISEDLDEFPVVKFHFAEGADLVLDIESMFRQYSSNIFCMTLIPINSSSRSSSIGLLAQQSYNVGYDLNENRIYFQRIDCELLGE